MEWKKLILAIVFIFCAEFLGALHGFYDKFWWWDKILHTSSGFLLGMAGFLLIYILNKQEIIQVFMKQGFIALFSFTFAVAFAALWEIYEFTMDQLFDLYATFNQADMQLKRSGQAPQLILEEIIFRICAKGNRKSVISLIK